MRGSVVIVLATMLAMGLSGCLGEDGLTGHFKDATERWVGCTDASGVKNEAGSFNYGGAVTCKTASERYKWQNPAMTAQVEWGGASAGGSLDVTILDAAGRTVHELRVDGSGARGGSGSTDLGMPGPVGVTWTIELEFREFTGSMGLAIESA